MGLLKGSVLVLVVAVILVGYAPPAQATYFSLSRVERGAPLSDSSESDDSSRSRSSEEDDDDSSPYGRVERGAPLSDSSESDDSSRSRSSEEDDDDSSPYGRVERGAPMRDSSESEDSSRSRSSEEADDDSSPYGILYILRSLISRVDDTRSQIRALQRRGCESGFVNYTICPQGDTEPLTDCNLELFENGGTKIIEIPISFTQNFDDIPAVTAALSGTSFVAGKNFEIAVIERMVDGFVIQVILEDLLPFELHFSWMACP